MSRRLLVVPTALAVGLGLALSPTPAGAASTASPELLGQTSFASGTQYEGTTVGGLSGTTYDRRRDVFYAISDDRSQLQPARFYTLRVTVEGDELDVEVVDVTTLTGPDGQPFAPLSLDPEGIALTRDDTLVIVSEGDANALVPPFVREFGLDGSQLAERDVPDYYDPQPGGTTGVRNNLAFESAGIVRSGQLLFTATENALAQDGPAATTATGSPARILRYRGNGRLDAEFVYPVDPVRAAPVPAGSFATNGLVELLPLSRTRLLALERGFSTGVGNSVRLYEVDLKRATDVSGRAVLPARVREARKELLLDLDTLGVTLDNLEALAFGPTLPDGRRLLLVTSDDNFSPTQVTQFLAFAV